MANVRTMRADEVAQAVEWAAAEGWNPGHGDMHGFLAQDPEAFLMAEEGGRMRACISAARYGADFGFIGFYIAAPELRGQGLGMAVWRAGMARLAGRRIGLDGVVAQQANYRKSGFSLAWNNARYVGAVAAGMALPSTASVPFERLVAYDAACFGVARADFLRAWIAGPGRVALVLPGAGSPLPGASSVLPGAGFPSPGAGFPSPALRGFAVARPGREGARVGPLFADDQAGAAALLAGLAAAIPGPLVLDVPEANPAAVALAQAAGMLKVFETARMYVGAPPAMALEKVFGVTSLEFG